MPKEGLGLHVWLLQRSRDMLINGKSRDEVIQWLLRAIDQGGGRTTQDPEIEVINAVDGAIAWLEEHPNAKAGDVMRQLETEYNLDPSNYIVNYDSLGFTDRRKFWKKEDQELRERIKRGRSLRVREGKGVSKFSHMKLFANWVDALLCCGIWKNRWEIYPLQRWLSIGLGDYQYIVPNMMRTVGGGKCDDNVSKEFYQVVEFDHDTIRDQWVLLGFLDSKVPLAMVTYSGNKSLHGWFPIFHLGHRSVKNFFRLATQLGADRMLWISSQYVRMPGGWNRETDRRQEVLYWNEEVVDAHGTIIQNTYEK